MASAVSGGDVKTKDEKPEGTISLKVATVDGTEVFFKCKMTTPLSKLMDAFCQKQGLRPDAVRFLFDGERIQGHHTPQHYSMEDGDTIDMVVTQIGGGCW